MKRHWRPRRQLLAAPDGQQRWDRAYQALLSWPEPATREALPATSERGASAHEVEVSGGQSDLRTGVDAATGAGADD